MNCFITLCFDNDKCTKRQVYKRLYFVDSFKFIAKKRHKDSTIRSLKLYGQTITTMQATRFLLRERIVKLHQEGYTFQSISEELCICYSTVRMLVKRYHQEGDSGLQPHYEYCGRPKPNRSHVIYRAALWLKRLHCHWGTPRIHLGLQSHYKTSVPTIRTLNRWFKEAQMNKPRSKVNREVIGKSTAVHNIWQLDAKENLTLADGQKACYLTVVDEKSGAWLASLLFPLWPYLSSTP